MGNQLIKHTMKNYMVASAWYYDAMRYGEIDGVKLSELPDDEETKAETLAMLIISMCEAKENRERTIQFSPDDMIEAIGVFRTVLALDKFARMGFMALDFVDVDEDGCPSVHMNTSHIQAQAKYFGVEFDENDLDGIISRLQKIIRQGEKGKT